MNGLIILLSLAITFHFSAAPISAQNITLSASDSADTTTASAEIAYDLPYPGILPGHPLYFLKVARDRFVGFLISDTIKKSEFNLLQSDKKLFAARMLLEDGKDELAVDTLSKSNNYMHNAISEANKAKVAKREVGEVAEKIKVSLAKHNEAIQDMIAAEPSLKNDLKIEAERLVEISTYYQQYFPQKAN